MKTIIPKKDAILRSLLQTILVLAFSFKGLEIQAQIVSQQSGNWSSPSTWVGGQVPGASDDVSVTNGAHTITVDVPVSIANFSMSAGTINGSGLFNVSGNFTLTNGNFNLAADLTVGGNLTQSGGSLLGNAGFANAAISGNYIFSGGSAGNTYHSNTGVMTVYGSTQFTGSAWKYIRGKNLIMQGGGVLADGNLVISTTGSKLEVAAGQTFIIDLSAARSIQWEGATPVLENNGTIQLSGTSLLTFTGVRLDNNGVFEIDGGEVRFASVNNDQSYSYQLATGSVMTFQSGTVNSLSGTNIFAAGDWTLRNTGATLNLGSGNFNAGQVEITAGTTQGNATLNVSGNVTVSSGTYSNDGDVSIGGNLVLNSGNFGGGTASFDIEVAGNIIQSGGTLAGSSGSVNLDVQGNYLFSGGSAGNTYHSNTGVMTVHGSTQFTGSAWKYIRGKNLIMQGGGELADGNLVISTTGSKLEVASGQTFIIDLSAARSIQWEGGAPVLENNGTIQLSGTSLLTFTGVRLDNNGVFEIDGGEVRFASVNNDQSYSYQLATGSVMTFQSGTVNGLSGTNIFAAGDWTLRNTGATLNLSSGNLEVGNVEITSGTTQGSATLNVSGNVTVSWGAYSNGGDVSIGGNLILNSGSFGSGAASFDIEVAGDIIQSGGTLAGSSGSVNLDVQGNYVFSGGSVGNTYNSNTGVMTVHGSTQFAGSAWKYIRGKNLIMNGGGSLANGNLVISTTGSKLEVASGQIFTIDLSAARTIQWEGGVPVLENNGTIQLSGTSLLTFTGVRLDNNGAIEIDGGEVRFASVNNDQSYSYQLAAGSVMTFQSGTVNSLSGDNISSTGEWTLRNTGATLNLGSGILEVGHVEITSGTTQGSAPLNVSGNVTVSWGTYSNGGDVSIGGNLVLNSGIFGGGTASFDIEVAGDIIQSGGTLAGSSGNVNIDVQGEYIFSQGYLGNNLSTNTGTANVLGLTTFSGSSWKAIRGKRLILNGGGVFNQGTLYISTTGSVLEIPENETLLIDLTENRWIYWEGTSPLLENYGTVHANGPATLLISGVTLLNEGTWVQENGATTFSSGVNNNGTFKGKGSLNFNSTLAQNGTIAPGLSPGILAVNGAQPFSASGIFEIEMFSGDGAGLGHSQMQRNTNLTLNGQLKVIETGQVPDATFVIIDLSNGTISGDFSSADLPAGYSYQITGNTVALLKNGGDIACPENRVIDAPFGHCTAVVNNLDPAIAQGEPYTYILSGATTGSGNGSVSGMTFNAGVTTVTYSMTNFPQNECSFTITVNSNVSPSVSIYASQNGVCSGTSITFTAYPWMGGTTPSYQWQVNNVNVGDNSPDFQSDILQHGDQVKVIMTSSLFCANPQAVTSNQITMNISDPVEPSVTISASATEFCPGEWITFTAVPVNGGSPSYQWKINGQNTGWNSYLFWTNTLQDGDIVSVVMTSNAVCVIPLTATSNEIAVTVFDPVITEVSISASSEAICTGGTVTFTASPVNGGDAFYQWRLNGWVVGSNSPEYVASNLQDGDEVWVVMTSDIDCAVNPATSNVITITVNPLPAVSISGNLFYCEGSSTQLTASPGASYLWSTGATTQSILVSTEGAYHVTVTDANGCINTAAVEIESLEVSIGQVVAQFPANNSFGVPDPVQFTWQAAANAVSYNLYIWRTNQSKPSQPTVSGITQTSYLYNEYLNKSYMYNWQVVAVNPCASSESAIHMFSFEVFTDLIVEAVTAPSGALAGESIPVGFTIKNDGIAATGVLPWKDDVFISSSSVFNINSATRIGTFNNVMPLGPGQQYQNNVNVTLPANAEGIFYLFVKTDAFNVIPETDENNNVSAAANPVNVSFAPAPDLAVSGVQSLSGNIVPGQQLSVGWQVHNLGDAAAVGGWSQRVALVSGAQQQVLGFAQYNNTLAAGAGISESASFMIPVHIVFEGDVQIEVRLTPNAALIEKPNATANNTAHSGNIQLEKRLTVSLPHATIMENAAHPVNATVYRSGNRSQALTIAVSGTEPGRLSIPSTIVIPAGQAAAQLPLQAIDNDLIDGNVEVSITANANGFPEAYAALTVIDDEKPALTLLLSESEVTEGDTFMLTVSRDFVTGEPLTVALSINRPNQLMMPASVIIPANQPQASVTVGVIDDNVPELTQHAILSASAGGHTPAQANLSIFDNDMPEISLVINPAVISEGGGPYASWGTLQLTAPAATNYLVLISASTPNQVFFPTQVSIPAGQTERQFNIGAIDNNMVDGDRTITITAALHLSSCNCTAPPESGAWSSQVITILDNDGPSLSVAPTPSLVPENVQNAGFITISRNTLGGDALSVSIQNNRPDEIEIAASATIPEGENSVQVPFNTLDDGFEDGDQVVTVVVSAQDYSSGSCWIIVSDRNLPDYVAGAVTLSESSLIIGETVQISAQIENHGFSEAASGVLVEFYRSSNPAWSSSALLINSQQTNQSIQPGQSVQASFNYTPTDVVGEFFIIVRINSDKSKNELLEINNTSAATSLSILPDYTATAWVDGDVFNGTTPITIHGTTQMSAKTVAANKAVDVYIVVNGARRVLNTTSNQNGEFSVNFIPVNGEAGEYYVGACYPGQGLNDPQDTFTILGARRSSNSQILWSLNLGETKPLFLEIQNPTPLALNNVHIEVLSGPAGCQLAFNSVAQLAGNSFATLSYNVTATGLSAGNNWEEVKLQITSNEGTRFRFSAWFHSQSATGNLRLEPVTLNKTMVQGLINYEEFVVRNNGLAETGAITIALPQNNWMSLVNASNTIPSLQPGETAVVTLKLMPGADLQLNNPIAGQIAINATNASGVVLPFVFEPVSVETGSLLVDVVNEYTYNTPQAPHLEGATVIVSHPYTGQIVAQGVTDVNGLFLVQEINEGYYNLRVSAPRHSNHQRTIFVEKGQQITEVVFIAFQAITYSWNVVPTLIQDQYEITLIAQFETNVPAPVVVMNVPKKLPSLAQGQVFPFTVVLTNHGLITAEDFDMILPSHPEYEFIANANIFDIPPQTSIFVPVIMQRKQMALLSSDEICFAAWAGSFNFVCGPDRQWRRVFEASQIGDEVCFSLNLQNVGSDGNTSGDDFWCLDCNSTPPDIPPMINSVWDYFPTQAPTVPITTTIGDCEPGETLFATSGAGNPANTNPANQVHTSTVLLNEEDVVCAKVTVQFSQTLTMTREAFEGTLTIFNGHESDAMQNIQLSFEIKDEDGIVRTELFEIVTKSLQQITGIDGTGSLNSQAEGTAVIIFIPERDAAPDSPRFYSFGGTLSYLDPFTGLIYEQPLYPVTLQVNPSPNLFIDYFLQRDIIGDDPLTPTVEPSLPAELAVMIHNRGAGPAYSVNIESAQPEIIDNEKGLLIDFNIIGSSLSGQPVQLGLLNVDFGDIQGGDIAVGQWWFTSSLLGHFISYEVSVNHLNSFGNPNLSLVSSVNVHELIRSIRVYGPHDDGINDFLVNDIPDSEDIPDALYYSNGIVAPVHQAALAEASGPVNLNNLTIELTVTPSQTGWNYARINDPGNGNYRIISCVREDGQVIPLDNIWLTFVTIPDGEVPVYENKLHFIDDFSQTNPVSYTVVFEADNLDIPEVVAITGIPAGLVDYAITSVDVEFNKPIDETTFTWEDMTLTTQGGPNLMDNSVVIAQLSDKLFNVDFSGKTNSNGFFSLVVQAAGIADLDGNFGQVGKQVTWVQSISAPAILQFVGLPQGPSAPIDSLFFLFNMSIFAPTFTLSEIIINDPEGNPVSTENLVLEAVNAANSQFRLSGLSALDMDGTYSLTVKVTDITGETNLNGLLDQTVYWTVCQVPGPVVYAGANAGICSSGSYQLSGEVENAASFIWTSSGSGTFDDDQSLNAVYTPGFSDIIAGVVQLTLTAQPLNVCASASSSTMLLSVAQSITPQVSIRASAVFICEGSEVTFTATPVLGGLNPVYQWLVNNQETGGNSNVFVSDNLQDGDVVRVLLYSSLQCAQQGVSSSSINMIVNPLIIPEVSIAASETEILEGTTVIFTATTVNGGDFPYFEWRKNGITLFNDASVLATNQLEDGDEISVSLWSDALCAVNPAISNFIIMTVNPDTTLRCPELVVVSVFQPAFPLQVARPEGGIYSGPGVLNGIFDPMAVGVGSYSITYIYTNPETNYTKQCTFPLIVNDIPLEVYVQDVFIDDEDCFDAMQTLYLAGDGTEVIIQAGAFAEFISAGNIVLRPGMMAEEGSSVVFRIEKGNNFCEKPVPLVGDVADLQDSNRIDETMLAIQQHGLFRIYPNPTAGKFTLEIITERETSTLYIEMYNLMGERIISQVTAASASYTFDLSDYRPGVYFIRVSDGYETNVLRLIRR